jgi:enoyl-CoA hydratase/carnithine racemase
MNNDTFVTLEIRDHVALVRFNRPEQLNAMNSRMIAQLCDALVAADAEAGVKVIVLGGHGSSFMAGADIKEYAALTEDTFAGFQRRGARVYALIEQSPKLVVAAVNGYALGGGFEIALASDLIVAHAEAKLGLPEIRLGLLPGGGGTQRLMRKLPANRALELLVTGAARTAEQWHDWGVVNVVSEGDAVEAAIGWCQRFAEASPEALAHAKRLTRAARDLPFADGLAQEYEALRELHRTPYAKARIDEFARRGS